MISTISNPGDAIIPLLVSSNLTCLSTWKVEEDRMGSDHFPISTTFEISCSFFEFFCHKYNLKQICWTTFHDALKDSERRGVSLYYFQIFFSNFLKPWFCQSDLKGRRDVVSISRLRSNHYALAGSLARKNSVDLYDCPCGHTDEDINHVLWAYPRVHKKKLKRSLIKMKNFPLSCVDSFLYKPNSYACNFIVKFLKDCELLV